MSDITERVQRIIEEKLGVNIIRVAEENGTGTREYELINVD